MNAPESGSGPLSRDECLALLRTTNFGRIAYSDRALPAIVTVAFALIDDVVVVRADEGSPMASSLRDAIVAFQAGAGDPLDEDGWSVTCIGRVAPLRTANPDAVLTMLNALSAPSNGRSELLAITPELLEGARFLGPRPTGSLVPLTIGSVAPTR
jgi:hypothetical protein